MSPKIPIWFINYLNIQMYKKQKKAQVSGLNLKTSSPN